MENFGSAELKEFVYLFTISTVALCMMLEAFAPRRRLQQNILWRWSNNFSLAMLTWYISSVAATAFTLYLVSLVELRGLGLIPYLGLGPVAAFAILLVVAQLINYAVHVAFHKAPWLWPIHAVHHSDIDMDISTSYRHHPVEPLVSLPLVVPAILLLGVPLESAVAYKLLGIGVTLFTHSNIRLPEGLDNLLRRVIVTPDFHRLHHCAEQRFTDSNYGSVLPWFDYLFGTASTRSYAEQETMKLGLEYARDPQDSRLDRLIAEPLKRHRN